MERTIRLHLTHGAPLEASVREERLEEAREALNQALASAAEVFVTELEDGTLTVIPSRSIVFYEVLPAGEAENGK